MHFPTSLQKESINQWPDEKMKNEMWFLTTSRQIKARLIIAVLFRDGVDGNDKETKQKTVGFG